MYIRNAVPCEYIINFQQFVDFLRMYLNMNIQNQILNGNTKGRPVPTYTEYPELYFSVFDW